MKLILSLILGCILVTSARAEELTERQKLAGQIVDVITNASLTEEQFRKKVNEGLEPMFAKLNLDEKSAATLRKIMADSLQALNEESIKRTYRDSYAERFTAEELEGIHAFYQTKAGKALLANGKELETQIQMRQKALVTEMANECMEKLQQRAPELAEKLRQNAK